MKKPGKIRLSSSIAGVDLKWTPCPYLPDGVAQGIDLLDQQAAAAFKQIDGKEIGSSGNPIAALVWHQYSVPENGMRRKALRFSALRSWSI